MSALGQRLEGKSFEVIVADGMSDDGTREILSELLGQSTQHRLVDNPARTVSAGLNAAIRIARGTIIVRMDAHTQYASDYVQECISELERRGASNVGGPARTRAVGLMAQCIAAAYHCRFACGGARFHDENYEGYADTVPYGCWHKATLEQIGLFDEALVRNQDDELNLRLTLSGGTIWQSPRIVSWYSPRASLHRLFRQYFQYGFWKVPVIRKHRIAASWRHLVPGAFVLTWVARLLTMLVAPWSGSLPLGKWSFITFTALIVTYVAGTLAAAIVTARKRSWKLLPILPVVFMVFHFAYGAGFVAGLAYWPMRHHNDLPQEHIFSAINR
jgi:glycosyltransferase involved in cell wall biosynthesis